MATLSMIQTAGSANAPTTNELEVDMQKKRYSSFGALTPLTSILARLNRDPAHNFRVDLIEEHDMPVTIEVAAQCAASGTTLTVKQYGYSCVDDTLLFNPRTFDLRRVNGAPGSDTSLTVANSIGGTTTAIWEAGDIVYVLLPAIPEDDETVRVASVPNTNIYNLVQLTKLQYRLTRIQNRMSTHFGGPGSFRTQMKQQKYREFRKKTELNALMGGRQSSGTAPATQRLMNGIAMILKSGTLYKNFEGTFTESGFDNWLGDFADQNTDAERVPFFAARNVIQQITQWGKDKIRISPMSKKYGLRLSSYIGPIDVDLIPMPLLTDPVGRGWGMLLDLTRIKLKDLDPPRFYPWDRNAGAGELIVDTYRQVTSLLLANEEKHAFCTGAQI